MAFVPYYILILGATIVIDYIAGILIERSEGQKRRVYLIISLISNIGFLAFFKYFNFVSDNLQELAAFLHWNYSFPMLNIILPIGLSFHTFQAMSYTIEVYRGISRRSGTLGFIRSMSCSIRSWWPGRLSGHRTCCISSARNIIGSGRRGGGIEAAWHGGCSRRS